MTSACAREAPNMAFAVSEYTKLLVSLSEGLRTEELDKLKFILRDKHITDSRAEKIKNGLDLFKVLEERDEVGEEKLDVLIEIFESIDRQDLVSKVKKHIRHAKGGSDGKDVPDGSVSTSYTASAYYVQPPETALQPAYSGFGAKKTGKHGRENQPRLRYVQPVQDAQREYRDSMMLGGYVVKIVGGKHYCTPQGEFVEMKSGTHFSICVENTHPEGCSLEISIDDYFVGEWELIGLQTFNIERPVLEDRKFTFYRAKLAPAGSGIQEGRPENGLISCVFTPEARISALVKSHVQPEPIKIEMPPHATVREMKQEAQRRLGLKEDLEQILSKDRQVLNNDQVLRSCRFERSVVLVLLTTELELRIETSTGLTFTVTINPGRTNVINVMEEIKRHADVPVEDQKLYHGDTLLSNTHWQALPAALIFSEEPQLFLEVPEYIQITVRMPDEEEFSVRIGKSKSLIDLQWKVPPCAEAGKGTRVWFIHEGRRLNPLEDRESLESYGVGPGAVLDVELEVIFIAVKVKLVGNETDVEVSPNGTVKDLLQEVPVRVDGELEKMDFTLDGSSLHLKELTASLQELGVKDGSVLEITSEENSGGESRERTRYLSQNKSGRRVQDMPKAQVGGGIESGWLEGIQIVNESLNAEFEAQGGGRIESGLRPEGIQIRNESLGADIKWAVPQSGPVTRPDPAWRPGAVTLQGHCSQQFVPVDEPIKVDSSRKVTLTLRLVARDDEEVGPFPSEECKPLASLVPPPVFEG